MSDPEIRLTQSRAPDPESDIFAQDRTSDPESDIFAQDRTSYPERRYPTQDRTSDPESDNLRSGLGRSDVRSWKLRIGRPTLSQTNLRIGHNI
uniref:Uncharacterized protein n=1 Tax=Acrobeloides nanus TaxID=290746 RepID=A0A914D5G3_9BILA